MSYLHRNGADDNGQTEPLLSSPSPVQETISSHASSKSVLRRSLIFMAFHFSIAFCEMILVAPLLSLFERSICVSYYQQHDPSVIGPGDWVEEAKCKVTEIQRELAYVRGWKGGLDTLPVFLVAVPMGKLADRYGRKSLMVVNLFGVLAATEMIMSVCAFPRILPIRLVWLSSLILFCGGGLYTTAALMWAMVSQAFSEEERSKAFYYTFSAFYAAELIASALASVTIDRSPWIGCILAICSIVVALALLPLMPASDLKQQAESQESQHGQTGEVPAAATFKQALSDRNVLLALPVFLVGALRYNVLNVLMQYTSVRFGWPISKTALIYTETAVVTITLFLILVPYLTTLLRTRYDFEAIVLDLGLVRASVLLMCIGSFLIAVSRDTGSIFFSVLVYAAGFGSRVSMLSLVSYWTSDEAKGGFYAAIAVLENMGHAIGDPSLQHIFAAVLGKDGLIQSMPFFVASALYGIASISALSMKLHRNGERSHSA